jgi:hypothetical protein
MPNLVPICLLPRVLPLDVLENHVFVMHDLLGRPRELEHGPGHPQAAPCLRASGHHIPAVGEEVAVAVWRRDLVVIIPVRQ